LIGLFAIKVERGKDHMSPVDIWKGIKCMSISITVQCQLYWYCVALFCRF